MAPGFCRGAARTPPNDVTLKDPKDFVLIGTPMKRYDTLTRFNGRPSTHRRMLPGNEFPRRSRLPGFGGKVGMVDRQRAKKIPGVQKIVGAGRSWRRRRRPHVGRE